MLAEDRTVSEIEYYEAHKITFLEDFFGIRYHKKRTIIKGYITVLRFVVIGLGDKLTVIT